MKVHGRNAELWINGSKVAYAVSWSAQLARDKVDVSTFADTWKVNYAGLPQITGSFEGLLDDGGSNLILSAAASGVPATIQLKATSGYVVASGSAWVDASVNAAVSDAERCSGSFQSTGAWTFG